jgi:hypothetical protein
VVADAAGLRTEAFRAWLRRLILDEADTAAPEPRDDQRRDEPPPGQDDEGA